MFIVTGKLVLQVLIDLKTAHTHTIEQEKKAPPPKKKESGGYYDRD